MANDWTCGISPLGTKALEADIDSLAEGYPTTFVSACRGAVDIELKPSDGMALTDGVRADMCEGSVA